MDREDLLNLIGSNPLESEAEYMPVACLLKSGYACVGYFNHSINENLVSAVVLLNMRLVDLRPEETHVRRGRTADFNDFLQDIVAKHVAADSSDADLLEGSNSGSIPLTAIPLSEIAILYPVAHIASLLKTAQRVTHGDRAATSESVPTFLDFNNKSIVLKVLRTKLW
jgi:hypothetical protein